MIRVRKGDERGHFDHGWLDTYHTFSFGDYHDPNAMGFRSLRVINEDRIDPGRGFGTHPHRDMEIITCVLEGELSHRDSLGTGSVIRPGELQRMTAGTGILHSEANASETDPVHLYQIWLLPERRGLQPGYEQRSFVGPESGGGFRLVASRDGRGGSLTVHQDVALSRADLAAGDQAGHALAPGRHAWVQVIRGRVELGGHTLVAGDGAALSEELRVEVRGLDRSEVLLFDLA